MKRILSLIIALVMLLGVLPVSAAGDAMDMEDMKSLLNSVELYPQRTGYEEVDAMLEEIFAPYADSDTFTKLKAAYDWTITEIRYSWAPYSQDWAPAYDCFVPVYELTYEEGLEEAMPFEVINRSYHALKYREGICYDYGAVFAVMARYLGIEAYVHTGGFIFEASFGGGSGHHGWAELVLNGENYIFDPQRDYRMSANGTEEIPYLYFGISYENAWRYDWETAANEARDAQFLSVTAPRHAYVHLNATNSGSASGTGSYALGETVTVKAAGVVDFAGWYDENGKLVSTDEAYSFVVSSPVTLRAVFEGEYFEDVSDEWYASDANAAFAFGLVDGTSPFCFDAPATMSRAMALTMLYRMVKPEGTAPDAGYADVESGRWYEEAVNWGTEAGIVNGIGNNLFAPNAPVTREQFITMMMRLVKLEEETELSYEDADLVSDFAVSAMQQAQAAGLLTGYKDNTLRPQGALTRAEGVTLLMRLLRSMEQ